MTSSSIIGTATPSAAAAPQVNVLIDGPCLARTLEKMEDGGQGRPMSRTALERLQEQAVRLLGKVVGAYERDVARGEVGNGGTARASDAGPLSGTCPTGLLYGRIQSGKTAGMIVASALALDNGFRVIVVLTSNYAQLVSQTASRFQQLDGPTVHSSNDATGGGYTWTSDIENIARSVAEHGLVVVCAKHPTHQRALIQLLRRVGAHNFPALIMDDEADQATPDTTTAARSQQRESAPQFGSTTYRLTVENDAPDEAGESLREALRHNVYLQVTATPYALFLQNTNHPLRPSFSELLEPGEGYRGGEAFFSEEQVDEQGRHARPPLVWVDDGESRVLEQGTTTAPPGLSLAIAYFLVATAAREVLRLPNGSTGAKFLCHTSPRTMQHDRLSNLIRNYVDNLFVPTEPSVLRDAYAELLKTVPNSPPYEVLVDRVRRRLHQRRVLTINATGSALTFGSATNFMVGGNILGRGLTIDGLLVTYYLRSAKTTQMDTMLQHARMFGYRADLMDFTRVFLPHALALRFHRLHENESGMRAQLRDPDASRSVPVRIAGQMRATRSNVLDVNNVVAYTPGQQVYPTNPCHTPEDLGNATERIAHILERAFNGEVTRSTFREVPISTLALLISSVRAQDQDVGAWDPSVLPSALESISQDYGGVGDLYVGTMERRGPELATGALSGKGATSNLSRARARRRPVLFMFQDEGARDRGWSGLPFWYPTLVFPSDMPTLLFNSSRS